jgi:FAD synthetase
MARVLVFGSFDGLHPGHESFLKEAGVYGDLIVSLPTDKTIKQLKGKPPKFTFTERKQALERSGLVSEVYTSDEETGAYSILKEAKPDMIFFGYDQIALQADFTTYLKAHTLNFEVRTGSPYEPERYKSSLLNYD